MKLQQIGDQLQALVDRTEKRQKYIHNIALGVALPDANFRWSGATGMADPADGRRMQVDTPFLIASITKMYMAAATMRLHEQGRLLAAAGFNPPNLVFPISAVILRRLREYRQVLECYSKPLLPYIEWRATARGNVEVLNDTADHYRYFDDAAHAEFLYKCVAETIERDLPEEVRFLEAYDGFVAGVHGIVDMPARTVQLLHRFLAQKGGRLSKRALEGEFAALSDDDVRRVEQLYRELFMEQSEA